MKTLIGLMLLICGTLVSCSRAPEPISYGKDACSHCKMTIMDNKFATEIVTAKGKIFKFDAIECMTDFINDNPEVNTPEALFLAVNIASPGTLIDARNAFFLKDKAFRSPMGGNLAAFEVKQLAENNRQSADWQIFTWTELLQSHKIEHALK